MHSVAGFFNTLRRAARWPQTTAPAPESVEMNPVDLEPQYQLGVRYQLGRGIARNLKQAAKCYQRAAELGHAASQAALALMYEEGSGLPKDIERAIYWYQIAATHENPDASALCNFARLNEIGEGVEQNLTLAVMLYEQAAELGNAVAYYNLGVLCLTRTDIKPDFNKAILYFAKATERGFPEALFYLGCLYQEGSEHAEQSYETAFKYYYKAMKMRHAAATCCLAYLFEKGLGVEQSDTKALLYYKMAADLGDLDAKRNIGWMYQHGRGVVHDLLVALTCYLRAAKEGHPDAMEDADALCDEAWNAIKKHIKGAGVDDVQPTNAFILTIVAAKEGHLVSIERLKHFYNGNKSAFDDLDAASKRECRRLKTKFTELAHPGSRRVKLLAAPLQSASVRIYPL